MLKLSQIESEWAKVKPDVTNAKAMFASGSEPQTALPRKAKFYVQRNFDAEWTDI